MKVLEKCNEEGERLKKQNIKPCPFCGNEVEIVTCGEYRNDGWLEIVHMVPFVENCRVFMDSSNSFNLDEIELVDKYKSELIERWNRRANDEHCKLPHM